MDYGNLISKTWDIIWKNKFLILLGVLVALSGSGGGGGNPAQFTASGNDLDWQNLLRFDYEYGSPFQNWELPLIAVGGIVLLVVILFLAGLVLWAVGTISRGGLISAVNEIELGNPTNFSEAFRAGWQKGWRLIGIGLVPAMPGLILIFSSLIALGFYGGFEALSRGVNNPIEEWIFLPILVLACILVPVMIILSLLRVFANRACMLEDLNVISSYRRGFEVLGENLGPAVLLFLLQIAISVGIGIMMMIPSILIALCCFLWPVFLLIGGGFDAFYSTLWTLAWREWTGLPVAASDGEVAISEG